MKVVKRVLPYVIGPLLRAYGFIVFKTARVSIQGVAPQGPAVLAIWHGRLAFMPLLATGPTAVLSSPSRDGRLGAAVAQAFGFASLAGSSSKQGAMGARRAVAALKLGQSLFLTADGPKGPRHVAKAGATEVARLARVAVVPCAASCTRGHMFGSWDKLLLPYPFARIVVMYGAPLKSGADATALSLELVRLERVADALCNRVAAAAKVD